MNNKRRGQSIIEYTLIAVLVILGIVIMGPYVLRSVSAHFKLWDDSVRDSYEENLTQAPVGDIPAVSTNCTCSTASTGGCGSSLAGSLCGPNQMIEAHTCSLQGCDGEPLTSCKDDPSCCSTWADQGCGTIPLNTTPLPSGNCYLGYEIQAQQCGSNNTFQCVSSPTCIPPSCQGGVPPNAVACPNTTTGLDRNYSYTTVQTDTLADCNGSSNCTYCGNPDAKCQAYCPSGYIPSQTGPGCIKNNPYIIGISFKLQNFTNTGFGTCRLRKNNNGIFDEGGDNTWGWLLNYTTGAISYGQGEPLPYLPILELQMSNGTISEVALKDYPSGGTLPGDWSHITNASITLTQWLPINDSSDYLTPDLAPSQIGIQWKDGGNNDRSMNCWDMCVNVTTSNGDGIHGC